MRVLLKMPLWQQVMLGLLLGVVAGLILKEESVNLKPLGVIFMNLIKMVIVPLVFFSLVSAITNMGQGDNLSRIGTKSVLAFLFTAFFAVVIGLAAATIFHPGVGVSIDLTGDTSFAPPADGPKTLGETIMSIIPSNAIGAMAEGHILQVVVFSIFVGLTLNKVREKVPTVLIVTQEMAQLFFKMIDLIVRLAPIGVFGFMAWVVGTQGLEVIKALAKLIMTLIVACAFQYVLFGVMIRVFAGISPMPFYKKMIEPQTLAFSTSSSKAALSTTMRILQEKMGVSKTSANFVLPLGASMNMDGTAIYLGICALFFAQATGHPLAAHDYVVLGIACTIASIGAAGIPSGSLIFMGMVLNSVGLPIEGIALIVGVDRVLDMVRTTINITGDATITLIIDKNEGLLDEQVYNA